MSEKNIKSRITHKHDTEANWSLAINFVPKQGEIIVYDVDANYSYERFKIGDGTKKVNELPFASVNIDSTLSIEGQAADAKAVGNAFEALGALSTKDSVSKSDLVSDVQASLGKADTALQSFTETDPTVPAWAKAASKPSYTSSEVGLGNVDNVKQYSASNPPPYPVKSVNGKTGEVTVNEVPSCSTSDNGKILGVVDGAVAWKTTTTPDWNQNDATQPDYINNRTHYDAGIADFTPSGSWTLSSSVTGLPSGMATGCFAGEFEVESDKIVPLSYDIGSMFGNTHTNVRFGEVILNTSGPSFKFCVNATYVGGGQWKLYFYINSGTLYGATPTISNIKIGVQLDTKYLPMNDIVSEVKNATGILPVESGGTGYSSITDTVYTAPRYRASSLHSSETTPTANGVICWTYE